MQNRRFKPSVLHLFWWRRGELNPCPKAYSQEFLRAQFVIFHSLYRTPANRLSASVESCYMTGATLNPYTFTTNRRPDPEPWSSQAGRASLIRQPVKNNRCCLIYKQLRLFRKRPHFRPLFLLQHPRRSRYVPIRKQRFLYSILCVISIFHCAIHFSFCIALCHTIALVVQFFALA